MPLAAQLTPGPRRCILDHTRTHARTHAGPIHFQAALITLQMMLAWLLPPAVAKAFDGAPRLVKLVPVWWSLFGTVWLFTQALWDGGWMDGMVALYGRLIPPMLEMTACLGWTEPQQIALCVAAACAAAPLGWDDPLPPRVAQARNSKAKRK